MPKVGSTDQDQMYCWLINWAKNWPQVPIQSFLKLLILSKKELATFGTRSKVFKTLFCIIKTFDLVPKYESYFFGTRSNHY